MLLLLPNWEKFLPNLLLPDTFIKALKEIGKNETVNSFLKIDKNHYDDIMKISSSVVYIKNNKLVSIVTTPIPEETPNDVVHFETLPRRESKTSFSKIFIEQKIIYLSKDKLYFTFPSHCCVNYKPKIKFCENKGHITNLLLEKNCYAQLMFESKMFESKTNAKEFYINITVLILKE